MDAVSHQFTTDSFAFKYTICTKQKTEPKKNMTETAILPIMKTFFLFSFRLLLLWQPLLTVYWEESSLQRENGEDMQLQIF